jgi:predicted acetyltransferase
MLPLSNKAKQILAAFFTVLFAVDSPAQKGICGNEYLYKDSLSWMKWEETGRLVHQYLNEQKGAYRSEISIPVVVHIVWSKPEENLSDELILSQIYALNRDYNAENTDIKNAPDVFKPYIGNIAIKFCLAETDPEGNPTVGVVRTKTTKVEIGLTDDVFFTSNGGSDAWNTDRYLNIWVANTGNLIAGFGTYPNQTDAEKTGVIVHPKYFGINKHPKYGLGRVATHEIGHYFGLKHLWADDVDCNTDDDVTDTPVQKKAYTGCPKYPQKGCSQSEMFMNFMDYVDDPCMIMFTTGQKDRMIAMINIHRSGLLTSGVDCTANQNLHDNAIVLFPNPSTGHFTCSYRIPVSKMIEYNIFNVFGQLVRHEKKLINTTFSIDCSEISSGSYFLNLEGKTYKFIKI